MRVQLAALVGIKNLVTFIKYLIMISSNYIKINRIIILYVYLFFL